MAAMIIHGIQPGPDDDDRAPALHLRRGGDDDARDRSRILIFGLFLRAAAAAGAAGPAQRPDADRLPAVHRRRVRHRLAAVRHLRDAGDRHRRVLPAPARLPDGAARARPRARAAAGQEPAPRPRAVRRQPRALLHAADLRWRSRSSRSSRSCCTSRPFKARGAARAPARSSAASAVAVRPPRRRAAHEDSRSCNEVLQPLPLRAAMRARRRARLRRPRGRAVHARRTTRATSPTREARAVPPHRRDARPRDHRPALAAGRAGGPVDRRAPTRRCASARVDVDDAAGRAVRGARRQRSWCTARRSSARCRRARRRDAALGARCASASRRRGSRRARAAWSIASSRCRRARPISSTRSPKRPRIVRRRSTRRACSTMIDCSAAGQTEAQSVAELIDAVDAHAASSRTCR